MDINTPSIRVRTFRIATGAYFVSFVAGAEMSAPSLVDVLERLPADSDLVLNLDGLGVADAIAVTSTLIESSWLRRSRRRPTVVCPRLDVRHALQGSGLSDKARLEDALEGALSHVVGAALLASTASVFGPDERSGRPGSR